MAPGAAAFPTGLIQSAHFVKEEGYVQVTGLLNRDAYSLSSRDSGGQYESAGTTVNVMND